MPRDLRTFPLPVVLAGLERPLELFASSFAFPFFPPKKRRTKNKGVALSFLLLWLQLGGFLCPFSAFKSLEVFFFFLRTSQLFTIFPSCCIPPLSSVCRLLVTNCHPTSLYNSASTAILLALHNEPSHSPTRPGDSDLDLLALLSSRPQSTPPHDSLLSWN